MPDGAKRSTAAADLLETTTHPVPATIRSVHSVESSDPSVRDDSHDQPYPLWYAATDVLMGCDNLNVAMPFPSVIPIAEGIGPDPSRKTVAPGNGCPDGSTTATVAGF